MDDDIDLFMAQLDRAKAKADDGADYMRESIRQLAEWSKVHMRPEDCAQVSASVSTILAIYDRYQLGN